MYDELYAEYVRLHDYFGRGENKAMYRLRAIRDRVLSGRTSMNSSVAAGLRDEVLHANQAIPRMGLATLTWGNVSGIDGDAGVYVSLKPSGVSYDDLTAEQLVRGRPRGRAGRGTGTRDPSVDSETHRRLYLAFGGVGGITHLPRGR